MTHNLPYPVTVTQRVPNYTVYCNACPVLKALEEACSITRNRKAEDEPFCTYSTTLVSGTVLSNR